MTATPPPDAIDREAARWRRGLFLGGAGAVALAALFVLIEGKTTFSQVLGYYPTRIRAVFLDTVTGAPLEGVSVLVVPRREWAEDPAWGAGERPAFPLRPRTGTTGPDGRLDLSVRVQWCRRETPDTPPRDKVRPPYQGVAALVVEKEGYGRRIVDCTRGRWTRHERREHGDLDATLDLGEIGLTPTH